jgi:hypothetical protein
MKTTDPRRIHVAIWTLPNGEEARVTVAYPTMNGLERAYTLHVQPIETRRHADGYTVETYTPSRGYRMRLESAARYSRRRLEALAEDPSVRELARGMFQRCADDVAA